MLQKRIEITSEHEGKRLDHFLHEAFFQDKSRNYVQQLIKEEHIVVNQILVKTGYHLKTGDIISIETIEEKSLDLHAVNMDLDIIYEDEDLLVINKPQGMVVHPASSYHEPTLVHGLLHQVQNLSSINGVIRPGIVHRIDKDTSGLLIVAKNDQSHNLLSKALSNHEIHREYVVLVYGTFHENEGKINAPIARHPKNRLKMTVIESGRPAITHFKVIKRFEKYTLLACMLESGRTHQIRVHMAFINHPVVGDPLYGPKEVIGKTGQFLHARKLIFKHPTKKEHMTFEVDMPQVFQEMIRSLS